MIKHTADGTIEVNVANTVLSASSSVTEILSKSPNVIENNGQLSVFGKGEAIIFLNGRQITNERLASIPVSRILKIEIISNPSSKYDAEGKAVINIITKTRGEEGIMGTASQQVTYSDFAGTNTQSFLDMSYVKGKLSVIGNYSLFLGNNREFLHTTRTRPTVFNLFPNLQLNTTVSKTLRLRASYISRITRPRYQALNPFVIYQDPFTTIEGNPNLIPEKIHAFEIGANYEKYDFRVGYNYSIDPIDAAALRGTNPNSYVLKAINLDKGHSYFASLARTINLKWWTSVNTLNLSYNKLIDNKYDFVFVKPMPQIYLYSSNTLNVKDIVKVQLLAWYLGRKKYGLYDDYSRYMVMMGIEKDFWGNKLKLRLVANDIFRRTNASGIYGVGKTDIYYNRTFNNAYFRCIANWNFGQLKKSNYKIKSTGQTENNRAN